MASAIPFKTTKAKSEVERQGLLQQPWLPPADRGRLVCSVAELLVLNRFEDAKRLLQTRSSLSVADKLALQELADAWFADISQKPDSVSISESDVRLRRLIVLAAQDVELAKRIAIFSIEARLEETLLIAIGLVAKAKRTDEWLRRSIAKWQAKLGSPVKTGVALVLGSRLVAAGALDHASLATFLAALPISNRGLSIASKVPQMEAFPAIRDSAAVAVSSWKSKARQATAAGRPSIALLALRMAAALGGDDETRSGIIKLVAAKPLPAADVIEILRATALSHPDLFGRRRVLVSNWKAALNLADEQLDWSLVGELYSGLQAVGADTTDVAQKVVAALDSIGDPEAKLPEILRDLNSRGPVDWLLPYVSQWDGELLAAFRGRDWQTVAHVADRLMAVSPTPGTCSFMLEAGVRLMLPPATLVPAWRSLEKMQLGGQPLSKGPSRGALRYLSDHFLDMLAQNGDWDANASPILRMVDWFGVPGSAILKLLSHAAATGQGEKLLAVIEGPGRISEEVSEFVRGLAAIDSGFQTAGTLMLQKALELGLRTELAEIAEREIAAAKFYLETEFSLPEAKAVVLIQSNTYGDLVETVRRQALAVHICAPMGAGEMRGADAEFADEDVASVEDVPFRSIDLPEVSEAAAAASTLVTRAVVGAIQRPSRLGSAARRYQECLRREVANRLYGPLSEIFNFVEAVRTSQAKRIFLIAANILSARRIVSQLKLTFPEHEIRVACGSRNRVNRLRFAAAQAESLLKVDPPAEAPIENTLLLSNFQPSGIPASLLPPRWKFDETRRLCIVVVTSARRDVLAPLPELVATLAAHWQPLVLFIDTQGDSEAFASVLEGHVRDSMTVIDLGALRPSCRTGAGAALKATIDGISLAGAPRLFDGNLDITQNLRDVASTLGTSAVVSDWLGRWLRQQFRRHQPEFVLFAHAVTLETQLTCFVARESHIPTFWLQMLQHPRDVRFTRPFAHHHLVLDQYSRKLWREFIAVPEQDITVVGSLRMSSIIRKYRGVDSIEVLGEIGMGGDPRLVLLATQPQPLAENIKLLELVVEAIRDVPDVVLVVKLHPNEPEDRIAALAQSLNRMEFASRGLVTKSMDTYRLIMGSELVVTMHSNVGIEAALLGRRVVSIVLGPKNATFSLADHGLTEEINDSDSAIEHIRSLLLDSPQRRGSDARRRLYLDANPEMCDGESNRRIVDAIAGSIAAQKGAW